MSRMLSPSSRKPYGLARVCRTWRPARACVYRRRLPEPVRQRPGPAGPMPHVALLERRGVLSDSPFHGEGHRKVWARLRIAGVRNGCAERFIRTLKENLLWSPTFDTVEDLRLALLEFRDIYNTTSLIQRLDYRSPAQVRQEKLSALATVA